MVRQRRYEALLNTSTNYLYYVMKHSSAHDLTLRRSSDRVYHRGNFIVLHQLLRQRDNGPLITETQMHLASASLQAVQQHSIRGETEHYPRKQISLRLQHFASFIRYNLTSTLLYSTKFDFKLILPCFRHVSLCFIILFVTVYYSTLDLIAWNYCRMSTVIKLACI